MKKYIVDFEKLSHLSVEVEATDEAEAEAIAWDRLNDEYDLEDWGNEEVTVADIYQDDYSMDD